MPGDRTHASSGTGLSPRRATGHLRRTGLGQFLAGWLAVTAVAPAAEPVVLRTPEGAFLREGPSGSIRADRLYPTGEAVFQVAGRDGDRLALKSASGRFLAFDPTRQAWLTVPGPEEPTEGPLLRLVPGEAGRVMISGLDAAAAAAEDPPEGQPGSGPGASGPQGLEIYRFSQIAPAVRSALSLALTALVAEQLEDRVYDRVRSRRKVEYLELPAPTFDDLKRKKRHRVLTVREEYHIQARLDQSPTIRITHMPCLKGLGEDGPTAILFAIEADVPVRGRVGYKVPGAFSASTAYRAIAAVAVVGELRVEDPEEGGLRALPALGEVRIRIRGLDLSNDLLNAARAPIEDLINRELRRNRERIHREANRAIRQAVQKAGVGDRLGQYLPAR